MLIYKNDTRYLRVTCNSRKMHKLKRNIMLIPVYADK